jgi:hypothetical protein
MRAGRAGMIAFAMVIVAKQHLVAYQLTQKAKMAKMSEQ